MVKARLLGASLRTVASMPDRRRLVVSFDYVEWHGFTAQGEPKSVPLCYITS